MKIKPITSRLLVLAAVTICTLAFTSDMGRSQYILPIGVFSITSADLDLDGDIDLVSGHRYNSQTHWSGISILHNLSNLNFVLSDSLFFYGGQSDLLATQLDDVENPEIIFRKWIDKQFLGVLYNNDYADTFFIPINRNETANLLNVGDIDGNGFIDIVFCSNLGRYWGVIYNHGYKNFTYSPFYSFQDCPPLGIACGDLNGDGMDDIAICGQYIIVYYSSSTGFHKEILNPAGYKDDVAITDFDLDGDNDLITCGAATWIVIYENYGDSALIELPPNHFPEYYSMMEVIDLNNDTLPDLAIMDFTNPDDTLSGINILYNEGNCMLSDPNFINISNVGESQRKFTSNDFDGNGYNDFAIIRPYGLPLPNLELLYNDGYGNFGPEPFVGLKQNPKNNQLLSCYPNPVLNQATFSYTIDKPGRVELQIYSINGQLLSNPAYGWQNPGLHSISWINPGTIHGLCVVCLKVDGRITQCLKVLIN